MNNNGIKLFEETDCFTVFADPDLIFATDVGKHMQFFTTGIINLVELNGYFDFNDPDVT